MAVELRLEPSPPRAGETAIVLTLTDASGAPLEGAHVRVEGNMNHAGMVPEFAEASETVPGRYEGRLDFTMAGDWFLIVTVRTADGREIERVLDVPGVARAGKDG